MASTTSFTRTNSCSCTAATRAGGDSGSIHAFTGVRLPATGSVRIVLVLVAVVVVSTDGRCGAAADRLLVVEVNAVFSGAWTGVAAGV